MRTDRLRSIAGCVLACIALAACARQGPVAGADATASAATSVSYAVRPDVLERATATADAAALALAVRRSRERDDATLGEARNARLFPARDPLDRASARLVRLAAEVSGFTVVVDYDFPDGAERFALGFRVTGCDAPAAIGASAAPSAGCTWRLRHYRRERFDAQGRLDSGIVADYAEGRARLLDHAVRPLRSTPMQTVPLCAGPAPSLQELGSVFDFSPALDVPVRH